MRFVLGGQEVTPLNYEDISLKLDFSGQPNVLQISVDSVVFVNEAKNYINTHLSTYGATEGMPCTVITSGGQELRYYVDFLQKAIFKDDSYEVTLVKRGANDNFFSQADGFTFDLGASKGISYELFDTPYAIIETNQILKGLTMSVALYTMTEALADSIRKTTELVGDFISAVGVDVSDAVAAGIKLAAQIAYLIALVIAIKKLCDQLRELIFPKVRYFKASRVKDLIEKTCTYLGYQLSSTLLNSLSPLSILPVPIIKGKENILDAIENDLNFSFTKGYPSTQDSVSTLGDLIRAIETAFNAKTTVFNGVVRIERRDYQFNSYLNNIIPALNVQSERLGEYELNTSDIWKRCYTTYRLDFSDDHTVNDFDYTDNEQSTEQVVIGNADLVSIKGLRRVDIPFSLASRKNEFNWLEKRVKAFFEFVDALTSIFGNGTNFAGLINSRIGITQISQQFFSNTKLMWCVGNRQPDGYLSRIGAKEIYENYHNIDFIKNYSSKIISGATAMISDSDFVTLQGCNIATIDGVVGCEIITCEWNDLSKEATISYRQPYNWAFNTKKIVIND